MLPFGTTWNVNLFCGERMGCVLLHNSFVLLLSPDLKCWKAIKNLAVGL